MSDRSHAGRPNPSSYSTVGVTVSKVATEVLAGQDVGTGMGESLLGHGECAFPRL